ncbi:Alpha-D-kanosaminyltransferase [bacterium HR23]|nr:Alpha-D-kanosaminyltransferase [bacterium HR23]
MRILMVAHHWHPHLGGLEVVARELATRLVHRGHQVTVVTSTVGAPHTNCQGPRWDCPVYRVPAWDALERWWGIPYPLFSPALLPILRRLVPAHDVVLVHTHIFASSVAGALMARRFGKPLVVYQHTPFIQYPFPWSLVERGADLFLGRWPLRWATRLVANSHASACYVQALTPGRPVEVIYPGVDTERFSPVASTAERQALRRRLGLPTDAFIALSAGRITYKKGLDTLVDACTALQGASDMLVVIVGDGPDRSALERRAQARGLSCVRFVGAVPFDAMPSLYRSANIFVLPSRTGEGFGLVLLEALASGLPVIATTNGGPAEVVHNGHNGLLVPPEDPLALAHAIRRLKEDTALAQRMGEHARATALQMDWERFVSRWEVLLQSVCAFGGHNGGPG